jgi:signal transduction histidine kinase/putative methionine-R-sulfoxide reductase with GAF domain
MEAHGNTPEPLLSQVAALQRRVAELESAEAARRAAEETIGKTRRALDAFNQCTHALVHATAEADLLEQVCRIMVETAGYRLAWVGYLEQDEDKSVRPVAQAGFEEGYLKTVNVTWADGPRGQGPTGTAARTGTPCAVADMRTDSRFAPWRAEAGRRGYAACLGLPLLAGGQVFGVITVYAAEPNTFDTEEVELLTDLADHLAYGIVSMRTRAARDRAEAALQRSHAELEQRVSERTAELAEVNARLRAEVAERCRTEAVLKESESRYHVLFEDSPLSLWEEDLSGVKECIEQWRAGGVVDFRAFCADHPEAVAECVQRVKVLDVNKATLEILEAPDKTQLLLGLNNVFTDQSLDVFREEVIALAEGKRSYQAETVHRTLSGKVIHVGLYLAVVPGCEVSLARVLVSMLNITTRKLAEAKVQREQQMLRQLLDVHEKHRQLIAYEIHDGLTQMLTGALMTLEGSLRLLGESCATATEDGFGKVVQLLRDALAESRRLMSGLRPLVLDEAGLLAAVDFLVAEARRDGPAEIDFTTDVQFQRLASPLETTIFRIVQEGLTNARRHSASKKIRLALIQRGDLVCLEIEDWGTGFDPERVDLRRFGLKGMRERAELFGGRATIDSTPGNGTRITVELPLVEAAIDDE